MTRADASERIDRLRTMVRDHDHRYYVLAQPTISDEKYDRLMRSR
jgi:DNA ligase (NAD+)